MTQSKSFKENNVSIIDFYLFDVYPLTKREKKNTVVVRLSLFELTMLLKEEDLPRFDRYVTACSINRLSFCPLD